MSGPGHFNMAKSSKQIGKEVIEQGNCAYEKAFPDCKLIEKFNEWLDAQKTVSAVSGKGADAGTVDFIEVPDYQTQIKAADIITDIRGLRKRKIDVKHSLDQSLMAVAVQVLSGNKRGK